MPPRWTRRRAAFVPPPPAYERGYGKLFIDHVQQADKGVDFDFLVGSSGTPPPRSPSDARRNVCDTPFRSYSNPPLPAGWERLYAAVLSDSLDAVGLTRPGDGAGDPPARRDAQDVRPGADRHLYGGRACRAEGESL